MKANTGLSGMSAMTEVAGGGDGSSSGTTLTFSLDVVHLAQPFAVGYMVGDGIGLDVVHLAQPMAEFEA